MEIGQSIRSHRDARGLTLKQLEGLTGIDNSSLSRIENGTQSLTNDTMKKLAKALGVSLAELFSNAVLDAPPAATLIPSLGINSAGEIVIDDSAKHAFLLEDIQRSGMKVYAHRINDDAMAPRLNPGDIVAVDINDQDIPHNGGTFVVALGSLTVRRIFPAMDGGFMLMPGNSTYPTITVPRDQAHSVKIAGRVKVVRCLSGI